jgi:hypothetical protein
MARYTRPFEARLRRLVSAQLRTQGPRTVTRLSRAAGRPSSWIHQFVRGNEHVGLDEAVALIRALRLQSRSTGFIERTPHSRNGATQLPCSDATSERRYCSVPE